MKLNVYCLRNDNEKTYSCIAKEDKKKGKVFKDVSRDIKFKVYFLPKSVEIQQPDKLVENTAANFTCTSKESNPMVEIIWRYNNNIITAGGSNTLRESGGKGFTSTSFLLMTLTDDHIDGRIKCEARHNKTDKSVFDTIDLDVKYTPKFTSIPGPSSAEEGETITLEVKAKANPNVIDYIWKRESGMMVPGPGGVSHSRWSYDHCILTLTNLQKSDAGWWITAANNSIGTSEARIMVNYSQ